MRANHRIDGAWLGSVVIAINKAWTARAFDASTEDLARVTQSGEPGFGLNTTNDAKVVIFGGGIPIREDGIVIGAVGASGGSVDQDVIVARRAGGPQRSGLTIRLGSPRGCGWSEPVFVIRPQAMPRHSIT